VCCIERYHSSPIEALVNVEIEMIEVCSLTAIYASDVPLEYEIKNASTMKKRLNGILQSRTGIL
jgi:hypothetical protein